MCIGKFMNIDVIHYIYSQLFSLEKTLLKMCLEHYLGSVSGI